MKRICNQCQTEMIDDCKVNVQGGMYGLKIIERKDFSLVFLQTLKHLYAQIVVM